MGDGYRNDPGTPGGGGATQSASANGACATLNNPVVAGGFGFGGSTAGAGCGCEGYGGGGGWYGGAGAGNCRGGGGGSSYILGLTSASTSAGLRAGNGEIRVTYNAIALPPAPVPAIPVTGMAVLLISIAAIARRFLLKARSIISIGWYYTASLKPPTKKSPENFWAFCFMRWQG